MAYKPVMLLCLTLLPIPAMAPDRAAEQAKPVVKESLTTQASKWLPCRLTTYHQKFEGRRTASGQEFRHSGRLVACRSGKFGTIVRFRYRSDNGNWHETTGVIADRGRLPLHREDCHQFDVTQTIAKDLGLYRKSKDYRKGEYQICSK